MALSWPKRRQPVPGTPLSYDGKRRRIVTTTEGVPLPFLLASRGARAGALMIDLTMIVGAIIGMTLILFKIAEATGINLEDDNDPAARAVQALAVIWIIALFLFRNAWFLFFELGPRGATPGKRIVGIRVAARGSVSRGASAGARLTTEAVIARNLVRDIELFMPVIFIVSALADDGDAGVASWAGVIWFLIFVLFPFFNRDRLRCGDLIAGTWVVEAPKRKLEQALSVSHAARGLSQATGAQYRFSDSELAVYGEFELQTLERVLRENHEEALVNVAQTICRKIGWSAGSGDERALLEAYYAQLRARLETGMRFGKRKADKHSGG